MEKRIFTSESVTEGHPDKICDAISDAILDALMEKDPMSRVACETAITTGMVLVIGEITTNAYIDMQQVIRETIKEIGYDNGDYGFDAHTCAVLTAIDEQSADIALGVNKALEAKEHKMSEEELDAIGAGDQGMMFGYACDETNEFMPYPISLAHKLTRQLTQVRKDGLLNYLNPTYMHKMDMESGRISDIVPRDSRRLLLDFFVYMLYIIQICSKIHSASDGTLIFPVLIKFIYPHFIP